MKTWVKNNWGFIAVIAAVFLWGHLVLKQDEAFRCSNESTAYNGCP